MTAGRHPNYFNESFFDKQSKIMLYFLGGSFSIYRCKMIPKKTEGYSFINQWQSSNKNWIEKLKLFLESEHKITTDLSRRIGKKDLFKTHTLNITSQRMHYALKEYHLNKHKTERSLQMLNQTKIPQGCQKHKFLTPFQKLPHLYKDKWDE